MDLQTTVTLIGVATAIVALLQGYDWWKKRQSKSNVDIVSSAIQLHKLYKDELENTTTNLQSANKKIIILTANLKEAQATVEALNHQLIDAQTEISYLRIQVKTMSSMLGKGEDETR